MFQRTILRQRRAAFSTLSRSTFAQSSLRQASPFQQLALKQTSFRIARRSYSTENAANQEDAKKENGGEAASPEDVLKKELEAKNKEVVDLKVS